MARDISSAHTLPSFFYKDDALFEKLRDNVFSKTWHYAGSADHKLTGSGYTPETILPEFLDQPVIFVREKDGTERCLSNVCTHRGSLLVTEAGDSLVIRCPYHGRCFGYDGRFRSMPGFEGVKDFPTADDNLSQLSCARYGPMVFANLQGGKRFADFFATILDKMEWFDADALKFSPELSRIYMVKAHWALYVDNYLEGFHVPFVHPGLNDALDVGAYHIECFANSVLQIGYASEGTPDVLAIPEWSEYAGKQIYALYWWIFPNLMLNYYPWGISLNVVEPLTTSLTRIRFETYVREGVDLPDISGIHQTELEDEMNVESVQRGMRSQFYKQGRYSPRHEPGVFHFHELLRQTVSRA